MCINVACCADVTVTKPLLDLLQAHAVGVKQACAAVAQVVEADALHIVRREELREMLAQKVGADAPAHRVDVDIVEIIRAVILAADLPVQRLLFLHLFEHLLTGRDQRKGAAAGFRLGSMLLFFRSIFVLFSIIIFLSSLVESPTYFIARQQARIQIAAAIYTQAHLRTSLFCFLLYQLSLWWVKYRAQPEAIST